MRVAVLGAGGPAGVSWCRALATSGHDVVAVDSNAEHLVWCEPYADTTVHASELTVKLVNGLKVDVVQAAPDSLVLWLVENQDWLRAATFLPSLKTVRRCQDKLFTAELWASRDLRQPPVEIGAPLQDHLHLATDLLGLPFWLRATKGAGARGATLVEDLRTAHHWMRYWQTRNVEWEWMAEAYLPGRDYAWTGIYQHGELVTSFARERLEYLYPALAPSGLTGTPTIARAVWDDRVNEMAEAAVETVDGCPHGIFAVDLREDCFGLPRPTEINPGRGGTTTGLWSVAGHGNFADLSVRLAAGSSNFGLFARRNAIPEGTELRRHIDCDAVFLNELVAA